MRSHLTILLVLLWSSASLAQKKDPLELVPLVDMQAPRVAVWFVAAPKTPFEDAAAVEEQIYEDFFKRMDIRMLSREKTLEQLGEVGDEEMQACDGRDPCLFKIGKTLKVDRMVGVIMVGVRPNYKIILKCFDLSGKQPKQLNAVVEGSLTDLLIGGTADAVASVFENQDQYAPVDMQALTRKKNTRPAPIATPPEPARTADVKPVRKAEQETSVAIPAPEQPGFFKQHLWSTIAAGTSVAFLVTGIVCGVKSDSIESSWGTDEVWDPERNQLGKDYALAANIMFGLSGAAAIGSVLLFFLVEQDPDSPVSVYPTGTGFEATVRF